MERASLLVTEPVMVDARPDSASPELLDTQVWRAMPYPIAATWRAMRHADSHASGRSRGLAAHEVLLRTLLAFLLADYLHGARSEAVDQQIGRLRLPTDGALVDLVAALVAHLEARGQPAPFLAEAAAWLAGGPERDRDQDERRGPLRACRAVVALRNDRAHHRAGPDGEEVARRELVTITTELRDLLSSLAWLRRYRLVHVTQQSPTERDPSVVTGRVQVFTGHTEDPLPRVARWRARPPIAARHVYLVSPDGTRALDLHPFVQVGAANVGGGERSGTERLFLFKRFGDRGALELAHDRTDETCRGRPEIDGRALPWRDWFAQARDLARVHRIEVLEGGIVAARHPPAADDAGAVVAGRYVVREPLGAGGTAEVSLVEDTQTGGRRALKRLTAEAAANDTVRRRFLREAETLLALRHEGVVPVFDFGEAEDGRPYLTMLYVEGGSLAERVAPGGLPWARVRPWLEQALIALAWLHDRGVVHRDIKPSNLLLSDRRVVVADFGVARRAGDETLTTTLGAPLTPAYAAPEQRTGAPVDGRADVYALGVVAHELLTGRRPLDAPGEGMEGATGAWLRRLGARQPDARPTAAAALSSLRSLDGSPRRWWRDVRSTSWAAVMAVVVALAVAVGVFGGGAAGRDSAAFSRLVLRGVATALGAPSSRGVPAGALPVYFGFVRAWNAGDLDGVASAYGDPVDCFFSGELSRAKVRDRWARWEDQFGPDDERRRRLELVDLRLHEVSADRVVLRVEGLQQPGGTAFDNAIVVSRREDGWRITTHTGAKGGADGKNCFPEVFDAP